MSKKKRINQVNAEIFNMKTFFARNIKRYGITLLIAAPIILVFNYVMHDMVEGYNETVVFFVSFAMLLFACLIALVIFTKIDDRRRRKEEAGEIDDSDPFAD